MKLPSLQYVTERSLQTFRRFPAALLCSFIAGAIAIFLVGLHGEGPEWKHLIMAFSLGVPAYFSLELFLERSRWEGNSRVRVYSSALLFFILVFYWWFLNESSGEWRILQYTQLWVILCCFVSFAPFTGPDEVNGYWQYNRHLVSRGILTSVYVFVLFGGLSLALLASEKLFGLHINHEYYERLWLFAAYGFWPWHFFGGLPSSLGRLEQEKTYPKALRIFSQYMLLPLFALYLLILYAYMGKIIVEQKWPVGWVGWLVSYASAFGLLMLLLLYPEKERKETRWIRYVERGFYFAVLPLLVLLFIAAYKRIAIYDLTEMRYYLVALGLWFFCLSLYMAVTLSRNIKLIPISLMVVSALTSFGPWGAYSLSRHRQTQRLEHLLLEHHLLKDGKAVPSDSPVPFETVKDISGNAEYLYDHFDSGALQTWSREKLSSASDEVNYCARQTTLDRFLDEMGLQYIHKWAKENQVRYANFSSDLDAIPCDGYRLMIPVSKDHDVATGAHRKTQSEVRLNASAKSFDVFLQGHKVGGFSYDVMLRRLAAMKAHDGKIDGKLMTLDGFSSRPEARLYLMNVDLTLKADGSYDIRDFGGYLLLK